MMQHDTTTDPTAQDTDHPDAAAMFAAAWNAQPEEERRPLDDRAPLAAHVTHDSAGESVRLYAAGEEVGAVSMQDAPQLYACRMQDGSEVDPCTVHAHTIADAVELAARAMEGPDAATLEAADVLRAAGAPVELQGYDNEADPYAVDWRAVAPVTEVGKARPIRGHVHALQIAGRIHASVDIGWRNGHVPAFADHEAARGVEPQDVRAALERAGWILA